MARLGAYAAVLLAALAGSARADEAVAVATSGGGAVAVAGAVLSDIESDCTGFTAGECYTGMSVTPLAQRTTQATLGNQLWVCMTQAVGPVHVYTMQPQAACDAMINGGGGFVACSSTLCNTGLVGDVAIALPPAVLPDGACSTAAS
jgi:hypothetical protein